MQSGNQTRLFALQHPIIDYLRVAVFAVIILITLFVVKRFSNRTDDNFNVLQSGNELVSLIELE